jgi:hypothetical protein
MQSQTKELLTELRALETQKRTPNSFTLYEEYSRSRIAETIRTRRSDYDKATPERRRELEEEVEAEVNNFRRWLQEAKNLEPKAAHYYAISLKSLLIGLPTGLQIAQLFSIVLDNQTDNIH